VDHGYIEVEWMDGRTETFYGRVRILADAGVLVIYECGAYSGHEDTKISAPMVNIRRWTPKERA
jgi:hypothetical protein